MKNLFVDNLGLLRLWVVLVGVIAAMIAIFVVIINTQFHYDEIRCNELSTIVDKETTWFRYQGCFIKVDGNWIPYDSWRTVE